MPPKQRQWKSQIQQQALVEYGLLKTICPEGIYLNVTPGNFALWSGVLFVRKGPYSPAVLRFQIAFPHRYPETSPHVLFTSDVFHPLVTPLTTYTYTTSSSAADPVSATDEERLLPGGFSLRHGFPHWFEKTEKRSGPGSPNLGSVDKMSGLGDKEALIDASLPQRSPSAPPRQPHSLYMTPPKDEGTCLDDLPPSIIEVLHYVKTVFENESLLDELPLEAAGNPGAWHAWRAHRRKSRHVRARSELSPSAANTTRQGLESPSKIKTPSDWNWDGVWAERVKRGVNGSLSESMLFGSFDGDDLIHFLDLDDEAIDTLRQRFSFVSNVS